MKCFFDLQEDAFYFHAYADMLKTAIASLRRHTRLEPCVVYDGRPGPLTAWLAEHRVEVIFHRALLYPELVQLDQATGDPAYLRHGPGILLKLDLTDLCVARGWTDQTILFCDCDVLFQGDPEPDLPDLRDTFFAAAPEDDPGALERLNTGVLALNVGALHPYAEPLRRFMAAILPEAVKTSWDQDAFRRFFRHGGWKPLAPELNWKPYWGINPGARIVHFHGPKPFLRSEIAAGRIHAAHAPLLGPGFDHYCARWDEAVAGGE